MEFACLVWVSEQTTNFALCSIKRLVIITEVESFLRSTHRVLM